MTRTMRDYFNGDFKTDDDLGIEVELESTQTTYIRPPNDSNWNIVSDGSLRNYGVEYTSKVPLKVSDLDKDLAVLKELITANPNWVKNCKRTSVHTHHNILDFTPVQIMNAATLYWLLENFLFNFYGSDREGSLFCLRLKDAPGLIDLLINQRDNKEIPFQSFNTDRYRYSCLNLCSIHKFGSLEIRGMRGTLDTEEIKHAALIGHAIVSKGKFYKSPTEIINRAMDIDGLSFIKEVLGDELTEYVLRFSGKNNPTNSVYENISLLLSLTCIDWNNYGRNFKPRKSKQKKTEQGIAVDDLAELVPNIDWNIDWNVVGRNVNRRTAVQDNTEPMADIVFLDEALD